MAIDAGEVVSGKAHPRIRCVRAKIALRIGDELITVGDEIVLPASRQFLDIANRIPVRPPAPKQITSSESCRGSGQYQDKTNYPPSHWPPASCIHAPPGLTG